MKVHLVHERSRVAAESRWYQYRSHSSEYETPSLGRLARNDAELVIQLGYWIVEALVDRKTEYYPKGGLKYLVSRLQMFLLPGSYTVIDSKKA